MSDRHDGQRSAKEQKLKVGLVPADIIEGMARALMQGLEKEGRQPHDWQQIGVKYFIDAYLRHTLAWWRGEAIDEETGLHHSTLAATNLAIIEWYRQNGEDIDAWQA